MDQNKKNHPQKFTSKNEKMKKKWSFQVLSLKFYSKIRKWKKNCPYIMKNELFALDLE